MPPPYTTTGKQVLHTVDALWAHYADAVTPAAAEHIAEALTQAARRMPEPTRWVHDHHTERQGDEYACSCGVRWDASEGEEHP